MRTNPISSISTTFNYSQFYAFLDKHAFKICADPRKVNTTPAKKPYARKPVSKKSPARSTNSQSKSGKISNRMFKPMYDYLDGNRDGKVSPNEIKAIFNALDTNND